MFKKPSSDQNFILSSKDAKKIPYPKHPYGTNTAAGQVDPRGAIAAEIFALREEIARHTSNSTEAKLISYDAEHGLLQINDIEIFIKPNSNQGLVCSVLIKNKTNIRKSWTSRAIATALDRNNPLAYSPKSLYEAARQINSKTQSEGLPKLIERIENRLRITKAYL